MSDNIRSRWVGGDLIFYTIAGVDIMRIDDAGKITILATGALEVAVGATVSGIVAASAATTMTAGAVELATNAETITGTDTGRAVVPAGLAAALLDRSSVTVTSTEVSSYATLDADFVTAKGRASKVGDIHVSKEFNTSNYFLWIKVASNIWTGIPIQGVTDPVTYTAA